ncbi:alpha/beta fold hydrolase [Nocardia sp. NBC_01388]|uniref:alpha/beta fold hydrolase n=1 Tax=Nocardia sp. NBC_01388 TaxID=2903596 RepID=UPI00325674A1
MTWQGATVGGMECGDRDGFPVLAFHGAPGSHVEGVAFADVPAAEVGVRLIAIDRPGMGMSELASRERVVDFADTVAAIADRFQFDRFGVLGASGGVPYALASACQMPQRVSKAIAVSSMVPFDAGPAAEDSGGVKPAAGLMILRRFPWLARPVSARLSKAVRTQRGVDAMIKKMSPADRARVDKDDRLRSQLGENIRTAFTTGSRGVALDFQLLFSRPWGFDLTDITVPVEIWHGDADGNMPVQNGRRLADMIPDSKYHEVPGAGHLLFVDHARTILHSFCD